MSILFCAAQKPAPPTENTLLWRITGKGLTHPSYLYGTMHLTDDRLFNFSDSLLLAIEKTEGFAMEVDPDDMITVLMEDILNDVKPTRLLKDVVSKKAFTKFAPLLSKRIGKKQDVLTVKDVLQEQNKWMQEAYIKGAAPTFVDAWLYDLARKQGKWVGGIEDIQDQSGLMEDIFNEQDLQFLVADYSTVGKMYLDSMIRTYERQDIATIEAMSSDDDTDRKDKLLLRRNVKMARRMDSLSAVRTMVFAVGAAHLPGDSGVISLLRARGFNVQPVFSSKKTAAKDYKVVEKDIPWQKIVDTKGLYEVEMPGKANPYKIFGIMEMRMNMDLFTSSGFMMMAYETPVVTKNTDSLLLSMARNALQDPKLKQGKAVTRNGISGREYTLVNKEGTRRSQLYFYDQTLYMAMVIMMKDSNTTNSLNEHFFNSLVLHKPIRKSNEDWVSMTGMVPGIQGETPVMMEYNDEITGKSAEAGANAIVLMGVDSRNNSVYMLITKSTTDGMYIPNDSVYASLLATTNRLKLDRVQLDTIQVIDGIYSLEQKGTMKMQSLSYHSKTIFRGNRFYSMIVLSPQGKENEGKALRAIQSLKLSPSPPVDWSVQHSRHLSTWAPSALTTKKDTSGVETDFFNAIDTVSSYVYSIVPAAFDSITWYNGNGEYWEKKLKDYDTDEDTVVSKLPFSTNGLDGYDLQIKTRNVPNKTKLFRLFNYGDTLYTMFTCIPNDAVNNTDVRRFFTDIKFMQPAPAPTVFTSKAASFIAALSSKDSAVRTASYDNVYNANFSVSDIPLLHTALMQHYDWDTGSVYYETLQTKLGDKLQSLKDSGLVDFIKNGYAETNGRNAQEQTSLLSLIAGKPTAANLQFIVQALKNVDENSVIDPWVINYLDDSLALVAAILPDALGLLNKKNMVNDMASVAIRLLDSNMVQIDAVLPYEPSILAYGKSRLKEINAGDGADGYDLYSVATIAGRIKTPACMALLHQMLDSRYNSVKIEAVEALLDGGHPIPATSLLTLAGDYKFRSELWTALEEENRLSLFPKLYKTQRFFSESAIWDYITEDDEPTSMKFITMQKATLNGKPANVYVYKFVFAGEEEGETSTHLGAIAFPVDIKKLELLSYSGMALLWDDEYALKNQPKQIKKILSMLNDQLKEDESD